MYNTKVAPIEKIIAILSYYSMGIVGLIWFLIAHFTKNRVKPFLRYNIIQSMLISILLAIFHITLSIILSIFAIIPVLNVIAGQINFFLSFKLIKLLGLSFSIIELFIFILLGYIVIGILLGRIFYLPFLTKVVKKIMTRYN